MNQSQFTRMVIGETMTDDGAKELCNLVDEHVADMRQEDGFITSQRLWEDGGRMVILEVTFETREACIRYHTGRSYRQFVQKTQHMLVGDFVVKLFKRYSYTEAFAQPEPAKTDDFEALLQHTESLKRERRRQPTVRERMAAGQSFNDACCTVTEDSDYTPTTYFDGNGKGVKEL